MNLDRLSLTATPSPVTAPAGIRLGLALSGGGNRSAAFSVGVLQALHERDWLRQVGVISAVSGGTYALSWLLLQPFHRLRETAEPRSDLPRVQAEMFDPDGCYQEHLVENAKPLGAGSLVGLWLRASLALGMNSLVAALTAPLFALSALLRAWTRAMGSDGTEPDRGPLDNALHNASLIRSAYREGIQRTYQEPPAALDLGPGRPESFAERRFRCANQLDLTRLGVPLVCFPELRRFVRLAGLPDFIFNATVKLPGVELEAALGRQVFEIGTDGFGGEVCGFRSWEETEDQGWEPGAPFPSGGFLTKGPRISPWATLRCVNVAPAISGAAVSHVALASGLARRLVKLSNCGLEYHVPNPAQPEEAVCLSDGGHSENLGLLALLRRRCGTILVVDAEHDPTFAFGSYHKLKQAVRRESGIELHVREIEDRDQNAKRETRSPVGEGRARWPDASEARVVYLKLSAIREGRLLGAGAVDVRAYARIHPGFPQESTLDQYFEPAQFRAYRALGRAAGHALPQDLCSPTT